MKTFLDSSVLLTAWRGKNPESALAVMDDPKREFCTSQLVKLELLPKPAFYKQRAEIEFYQTHFRMTVSEEPLSRALGQDADNLALLQCSLAHHLIGSCKNTSPFCVESILAIGACQ